MNYFSNRKGTAWSKKVHKFMIIEKLGLSKKFLRVVLHTKKIIRYRTNADRNYSINSSIENLINSLR